MRIFEYSPGFDLSGLQPERRFADFEFVDVFYPGLWYVRLSACKGGLLFGI
jgi:hypothetical protein